MPTSRKFSDLRDAARQDPARPAASTQRRAGHSKNTPATAWRNFANPLGLTPTELADLMVKAQSANSQIDTGEIGLPLDVLRAIAAPLGGSLEVSAIFEDRWSPSKPDRISGSGPSGRRDDVLATYRTSRRRPPPSRRRCRVRARERATHPLPLKQALPGRSDSPRNARPRTRVCGCSLRSAQVSGTGALRTRWMSPSRALSA